MPPIIKITVLTFMLRVLVRWFHLHFFRLDGVHGVSMTDTENHIIRALRVCILANFWQRLEMILDLLILAEQPRLSLLHISINLRWFERGSLKILVHRVSLSPVLH